MVKMLNWSIEEYNLPLKAKWAISRSAKREMQTFIVKVNDGDFEGMGEVSFSAHYGETRELIIKSFDHFKSNINPLINSVEDLIVFLRSEEYPTSFRFGVESAFIQYLSLLSETPVHELLNTREVKSINTSFSVPIMEVGKVKEFIEHHNLNRFKSLKVKVDADNGYDLIKEVEKNFGGNIRIDANEDFPDADFTMGFVERLGASCPIEFLEQPMKASDHEGYKYLKDLSEVDIMADESLIDGDVTEFHAERFHAINVKLMKAGSYLTALKQLRLAKEFGMKTMIGCMIETSLGISSALNIAHGVDYYDLDGSLFLEKDPFGLIEEEKGRIILSHLQ